jgi:hypothetical protein
MSVSPGFDRVEKKKSPAHVGNRSPIVQLLIELSQLKYIKYKKSVTR